MSSVISDEEWNVERPFACTEHELHARLERLARDELDLCERIGYRVAELKGDGRWMRDDAACQHLSEELFRIRAELAEAREAFLREPGGRPPRARCGDDHHRDAAMHYDHPIEVLARSTRTRFQLGFARRTVRLVPSFKDVVFEPSAEGLLVLAADEAALALPVEALRQMHGGEVEIGEPRVRFFVDGVVHEPVMWVRAAVDSGFVDAVARDLAARGAEMQEIDPTPARPVIKALAPLARLLGYPKAIAALTAGSADLVMWLSHYAPVPPQPPLPGRAA
jgi:hypothetical protein